MLLRTLHKLNDKGGRSRFYSNRECARERELQRKTEDEKTTDDDAAAPAPAALPRRLRSAPQIRHRRWRLHVDVEEAREARRD